MHDDESNQIDYPLADAILDVSRALIRPVITFMFACSVIYFTFEGLLSGDYFIGLATGVIMYYFTQRGHEKQQEALQQATTTETRPHADPAADR